MHSLFFELIRVAIGTQDTLSRLPSASDWGKLYKMAQKQSLVGVCFAGLQRLGADADEGFARIGMSEELYFDWMGNSFMIQQKNGIVNQQCAELQAKLSADGLRSCILKGQGVALLYPEDLRMLRQSGDIDVWAQNRSVVELMEYVRSLGLNYKATTAHVECNFYEDTDVEFHSYPAFMRSFYTDNKLRKWTDTFNVSSFTEINGIVVPPVEFNLVYMMVHMYHHVLFEGIGLRQPMDYFFVLSSGVEESVKRSSMLTINRLGMSKFAKGIMWIIKKVFGLPETQMLCEADEKVGRLLLDEMMAGGNFGHHDKKNKSLHGGSAVRRSLNGVKRNMKFFALGPMEVLSFPLWSTWHWCWRKRRGMI